MEELLKASEGLLIVGLIVSVIQIILIGALAQKKNRSIVGWCIATLFFGLIPFIILAFQEDETYIPRNSDVKLLERVCPSCGKKINSIRCPYCVQRTKTVSVSDAVQVRTDLSVKVQKHNGMIHCPKCKLTQKADSTYCQGCGIRFDFE
jgi:hypothetical protein